MAAYMGRKLLFVFSAADACPTPTAPGQPSIKGRRRIVREDPWRGTQKEARYNVSWRGVAPPASQMPCTVHIHQRGVWTAQDRGFIMTNWQSTGFDDHAQ